MVTFWWQKKTHAYNIHQALGAGVFLDCSHWFVGPLFSLRPAGAKEVLKRGRACLTGTVGQGLCSGAGKRIRGEMIDRR